MTSLVVTLPMRVNAPANASNKGWRSQAEMRKKQRLMVARVLAFGGYKPLSLPVSVTFTRVGKKELDDDNLMGAFKSIRDEVARWLGCGDGPKDPVKWHYKQEAGDYQVKIEIVEVRE